LGRTIQKTELLLRFYVTSVTTLPFYFAYDQACHFFLATR